MAESKSKPVTIYEVHYWGDDPYEAEQSTRLFARETDAHAFMAACNEQMFQEWLKSTTTSPCASGVEIYVAFDSKEAARMLESSESPKMRVVLGSDNRSLEVLPCHRKDLLSAWSEKPEFSNDMRRALCRYEDTDECVPVVARDEKEVKADDSVYLFDADEGMYPIPKRLLLLAVRLLRDGDKSGLTPETLHELYDCLQPDNDDTQDCYCRPWIAERLLY